MTSARVIRKATRNHRNAWSLCCDDCPTSSRLSQIHLLSSVSPLLADPRRCSTKKMTVGKNVAISSIVLSSKVGANDAPIGALGP